MFEKINMESVQKLLSLSQEESEKQILSSDFCAATSGGIEVHMKVKMNVNLKNHIEIGETPRDIVQAYRKAMFEQREVLDNTILYRMETELFNCIKSGKPGEITALLEKIMSNGKMVGMLSKDPLRQAQYTFIAGLTLATRSAIEGGMPEIEAFNLSDVYAQKADQCKKIDDIVQLNVVAYHDFAKRVQQVKKRRVYSYPVSICIDYISNHLHYQINLEALAKQCNLTPQYLSSLFRKEIGTTLTDYILKEKLETAKQMLTYSDYSLQEISNYLAFCSHSNFTAHFRKRNGITPREYRDSSRTHNLQN
jgi:YesN/AraC family two-component response regulator